jgi:hypothetical protein
MIRPNESHSLGSNCVPRYCTIPDKTGQMMILELSSNQSTRSGLGHDGDDAWGRTFSIEGAAVFDASVLSMKCGSLVRRLQQLGAVCARGHFIYWSSSGRKQAEAQLNSYSSARNPL